MTKQEQAKFEAWLNHHAAKLWDEYCEIFPKLVKCDVPRIVLNNRFTRTAGCCYQDQNIIHLGTKFFAKNNAEMLAVILPHEMAHQIDFNLYGISEKKCGHGKMWQKIMVQLGLPADRYHSLVI